MRPVSLLLPLCAALLGACGDSTTSPDASSRRAAGKPEHLLIGGSGWTLVSLPFAPAAMNDAGVIVGTQNGEAVRWENGALTALPHFPGIAGPYAAKDITSKGYILGVASGHPLIWTSPTATPIEIVAYPFQVLAPVAMNDDLTVVGQATGRRPWRWTQATGLRYMSQGLYGSRVTGVNSAGYASGLQYAANGSHIPIRWSPSGVATALYVPMYTATALAINDAGTVVGNGEEDCGGNPSAYDPCPLEVYVWTLNGGFADLYSAFTAGYASSVSNPGRIVGGGGVTGWAWTYYNGVLTQLSHPDVTPPQPVDVNSCGSIVAVRFDVAGTGYLWRRGSSFMATCDVAPAAI